MSDDEGSRVRTEPDDGIGDLFGPAHPSDWLLRDHPRPPLRGAAGEASHHRAIDVPGADGVDADVRRRVVEGRRPGEADHAVFRGGVRGVAFDANDPGTRGGVDDRAAPLLEHQGISYFMHRKTPRRSMLMIRSHSSSSTSAVGTNFFGSTPALLKATSSRPKASPALSKAALTSSPRVTSHVTASARPPCSSIMRAVSWLPCSDTSVTTTLAPSRANASAAARPMPLAAPVTNATFPVKSALPCVSIRLLLRGLFRNLWVVKWVASWTQQRLDRATLIHRAVTVRDLLERQRQVEDLAGIDLALPHEVDQLGQVAAYGGRSTVEVDVREEQLLPSDLDAMRNTDVAHVSARGGGPDRLHHRLLRADALQHGVGAESVGQLFDTGDARVTPLGDDVGRAELACES